MVLIAESKKRGRPPVEWDAGDIAKFKELCAIFCTRDEISAVFGVSHKTLNRLIDENLRAEIAPDTTTPISFEDAFEVYSAAGRASLRRQQYKKALEGNTTMLIWLGKQHLGQDDRTVVVEQKTEEATPLDDITRRLADIRNSPED